MSISKELYERVSAYIELFYKEARTSHGRFVMADADYLPSFPNG